MIAAKARERQLAEFKQYDIVPQIFAERKGETKEEHAG